MRMINVGSSISAPPNAIIIARPINRPNEMLGIKFDKARMEKPIIMAIDV